MKYIYSIGLCLCLSACAFNRSVVVRKHEKFVTVANFVLNTNISQLKRKDVSDSEIKKIMTELKIDVVTINNQGNQYAHEPNDSVIVFINHGPYIFGKYKRVFYDYSAIPRKYKDTCIEANNYLFMKVRDRFYISYKKTDR